MKYSKFISTLLLALLPLGCIGLRPENNFKLANQEIELLVESIQKKEEKKDATCWSTLRTIDRFYVGKKISDYASLLEMQMLKNLALKLYISSDGNSQKLESIWGDIHKHFLTPNIDNYSYKEKIEGLQSTAEGLRIILSTISSNNTEISNKNSQESLNILADYIQTTKLELLYRAKIYSDEFNENILGEKGLKKAFSDMIIFFPLQNLPSESISEQKRKETKTLIQKTIKNKIISLKEFNHWNEKQVENNFNEFFKTVYKTQFSSSGLKSFSNLLESLVNFISRGQTNFGTDINIPFNFVSSSYSNTDKFKINYLTLEHVQNTLESLFPRTELENGDVIYRISNNLLFKKKGSLNDGIKTIVLRNFEMDSFRDFIIPWQILERVWNLKNSLPIDPLALELLVDRISEIGVLLIKETNDIRKNLAHKQIDRSHFDLFLSNYPYLISINPPDNQNYCLKKNCITNFKMRTFKDITSTSNLIKKICPRELMLNNSNSFFQTIKILGSGIGVGDFNNDGLLDVFYPGEGCNRLFKNKGKGKFEDVTRAWGLPESKDYFFTHQAIFVDINNDFLLDLFIIDEDGNNKLYIQNSSKKFLDISKNAGIKTTSGAMSATFTDINNDGLLDLYIGNYGIGFPNLSGDNGAPNNLFLNLGKGKFKDISISSGTASNKWTLVVGSSDFNNDGLLDLFSGNVQGYDEIFINLGNSTFLEQSKQLGFYGRGDTMTSTFSDINNDGFSDIFITAIDMFSKKRSFIFPNDKSIVSLDEKILKSSFYLTGNALFLNDKGNGFHQNIDFFPPKDQGLSWSANFFDFNNDGEEDFYLATGFIDNYFTGDQHNLLFIRKNNFFSKVNYDGIDENQTEQFKGNSRSVISEDIDNDGRIDLIVSNFNKPLKIFKNIYPSEGQWINLGLRGKASNSYGVGSKILFTFNNGRKKYSEISAGSLYLGQTSYQVHVGFKKNESLESIEVKWPSGKTQVYRHKYLPNKNIIIDEDLGVKQ